MVFMDYNCFLNYKYKINLFGLSFLIIFTKDFYPKNIIPHDSIKAIYIDGEFNYAQHTNFPYKFIDETNKLIHTIYGVKFNEINTKDWRIKKWELIFETQFI
jgi:hypothetical protein